MIPFSVLDLCPILQDGNSAQSFADSVELAQLVEKLNFKRFWLAEFHNSASHASAATSIIISHIANATNHIRVGSGGIILPNHSPLIIAEQFGTLATLYPNRIDLGIGRAPTADPIIADALRRDLETELDTFPEDLVELRYLLQPKQDNQSLVAIPGEGTKVPMWLLGSTLFSAGLSANLGMPFAFGSHFAPDFLMPALALYRSQFQSLNELTKPYCMAALVVVVAETDQEAQYQFSSLQQQIAAQQRGKSIPLPPPCKDITSICNNQELENVNRSLTEAIVGSPDTVKYKLQQFIDKTQVDELIITSRIYDREARLYSFTKIAEIRDSL
ncbi:LLM class flavin-dependent oxidoreductase [Entomomonas sp. E2T0]|uniref:LLM class flavin-dependent oxidoreductase n=1 Tax=Entomomonas sp. E2T0 TaxID=2930213 RepID=UPI00222822E1|nr:LLM class flavin-dependent oxidoreductase [Entomomonas sp. E2T0]UYZ83285.1 LLM class flavin-dependent oxidoreductase [Entomomonas sp. E2T0]